MSLYGCYFAKYDQHDYLISFYSFGIDYDLCEKRLYYLGLEDFDLLLVLSSLCYLIRANLISHVDNIALVLQNVVFLKDHNGLDVILSFDLLPY